VTALVLVFDGRVRCPSCARLVGSKTFGPYPHQALAPRKHNRPDGVRCPGSWVPVAGSKPFRLQHFTATGVRRWLNTPRRPAGRKEA